VFLSVEMISLTGATWEIKHASNYTTGIPCDTLLKLPSNTALYFVWSVFESTSNVLLPVM
jgi:hypothetical protein